MFGVGIACRADPPSSSFGHLSGEAFGTTWRVTWQGELDEAAVRGLLDTTFADVDATMSSWRSDSELALLPRDRRAAVSEPLYSVVASALDVAAATNGAFDPTVEPLLELWGFRGDRITQTPSDDAIAETLQGVGWQRVSQGRSDNGEPWIDLGGATIDLSAIAKGTAVDRASWALSQHGASAHLVEVGGEVRAHGRGPHGAWTVGVEWPSADAGSSGGFAARVPLRNAAMATSGDYRNVYVLDGDRVVHTMNPVTGRPAQTDVLSATVLAETCEAADAWATALRVMGAERAMVMVERRHDVEAMLQRKGPDGDVELRRSSGFPLLPGSPTR